MILTALDHPKSALEPTCHLVSRVGLVRVDRRRKSAATAARPASRLVGLLSAHLVLSLEWWCVVGKAPSWVRRLRSGGICIGASI